MVCLQAVPFSCSRGSNFANDPGEEAVELVTEQIAQIRQPWAAILGNHDAVSGPP